MQGLENVEASQAQGDPQVPPAEHGQGEVKIEVQEVSLTQQVDQSSPSSPKRRKIKNPLKEKAKGD